MDKLLNVFRKLLITLNWIFFGALSATFFIAAISIEDQTNQDGVSPYLDEWWYPYLTMLSDNPDQSIITWVGIGCIIIAYIVYSVIQWIFE